MRSAGRLVVLVGAPLLVASLVFSGLFETDAQGGASRVLALLILAAEACGLVSGWLYAYDKSRFPLALILAGRFFVLAGLLSLCDGALKDDFFGESFGTAFVMVFAGVVAISMARGAVVGDDRKEQHE